MNLQHRHVLELSLHLSYNFDYTSYELLPMIDGTYYNFMDNDVGFKKITKSRCVLKIVSIRLVLQITNYSYWLGTHICTCTQHKNAYQY